MLMIHEYISIEPDGDPVLSHFPTWLRKRKWMYQTKKMARQLAWCSRDGYIYFLYPPNIRLEDQTEEVYVIKIENPSSNKRLLLTRFDLMAIQDTIFFHRAYGRIERILKEQISKNFSKSVLQEMRGMAERFSRMDAGLVGKGFSIP